MQSSSELLRIRLKAYLQNKEASLAIKWLYDCLSTLDSKASALLRVNGIFIALVSGAMLFGLREKAFNYVGQATPCLDISILVLFGVSFVLLLTSSLLCHLVARIEWPFLGRAMVDTTPGDTQCDLAPEAESLFEVVDRRTRMFQWAWQLSPWAILLTAISLVTMVVKLLK